ncbi:MAG: efflux RND transporter periplasmic adaptor subunit [Candidatus Dechloromonas phosphoritropha]|jgi:multidrug efflux system membrane fusion protein|nr:efflux RND transporter periplasmic adaptor subunit [Candidatus Dechloromonas phosphoritropha]MBP8789501.1 efflux RND transporter periplasmic adaptor subunit [Azonexus sp.]
MTKSKALLAGIALAAVIGAGYWYQAARSSGSAGTAKTLPRVPVTVAEAVTADIPVLLEVVGRAEAYESVTVKSRLDGQVASVMYTEGQHVKQGDVLVKLDPGDFDARLQQASANLAKDEAQLAKAHADVGRYVTLKARGFVSDEKVSDVRTAEAAALATVKADKAALELARLQLTYATLRAPFAGVVGARLVFPGTAVKVNDTALVVINRVQPLYVTFSVPEKYLPRLQAALERGQLTAVVTIPGNKEQPFEANVRFIDNAVDTTTGTIQMKAVLENREKKLTPGQFLNVTMRLDTLTDAVVVPTEAVQQGSDGNFLYVVKQDETVEPRKIQIATTSGNLAAIAKGVAAGETIVTDGQLRLAPGASVQIKSSGPGDTKMGDSAPSPAVAQSRN